MLTIFSIPKPFRGRVATIQRNATYSWNLLRPQCDVILFGDEEGTAEIAATLKIRHISNIERNEYGTPLISSIFGIAQNIAKYQLMCYVNADIILTSDLIEAVQRVCQRKNRFLLTGQRWDFDLTEPIDFAETDWEKRLRIKVMEYGKLHPRSGIDYFVFPRGLYADIPPFAIRGGWDNWLVYYARSLKVPVIDATQAITAIHQNHDYSHHPGGLIGLVEGPEAKRNIELMGGRAHAFSLEHATWILTPNSLRRALTMRHLYFRLEALPTLVPWLRCFQQPMKMLTRLIVRIRSSLGIRGTLSA